MNSLILEDHQDARGVHEDVDNPRPAQVVDSSPDDGHQAEERQCSTDEDPEQDQVPHAISIAWRVTCVHTREAVHDAAI